jgi:hypothetical protein
VTDWTELQRTVTTDPAPLQHYNSTFQMSSTPLQSMKCVCTSSATIHVLPIGLQLQLYPYKLGTGGMQNQCTLTIHSKNYVSCIMMHECSLTSSSKKKKKKKVSNFFFYQNVKSVKILLMSGMPFHFNVLDF